ncbi:MAG: hypothetical protein JRI55_22160 [Deltaproteobacteria bacterium]|nr:hypothetical protein [Deltaproteobacteria bacterium]
MAGHGERGGNAGTTRRGFLGIGVAAGGLLLSSALPGCGRTPAWRRRRLLHRYGTIAHAVLDIEWEGEDAAGKAVDFALLERLLEEAGERMQEVDEDNERIAALFRLIAIG